MAAEVFAAALEIEWPWLVVNADFDQRNKVLTLQIDFNLDGRFAVPGIDGAHPVHNTLA